MNQNELKQWLRDNSSGIYRPALEASDAIEKLERENASLKVELERAKEDRNRIAKQVRNNLLAELRASEGVAKALADWRETRVDIETNEAKFPSVPAPLVFES